MTNVNVDLSVKLSTVLGSSELMGDANQRIVTELDKINAPLRNSEAVVSDIDDQMKSNLLLEKMSVHQKKIKKIVDSLEERQQLIQHFHANVSDSYIAIFMTQSSHDEKRDATEDIMKSIEHFEDIIESEFSEIDADLQKESTNYNSEHESMTKDLSLEEDQMSEIAAVYKRMIANYETIQTFVKEALKMNQAFSVSSELIQILKIDKYEEE